ncbi:hypothetical protein [Ideonella sp. A 288]|uniref:hypothetical protein n=1 Tax=Ideonella sp. A 288 TaxID=1962181 RepID=UPI000B4A7935|nr:hypothetical protein [Ideonella sp. A 288]
MQALLAAVRRRLWRDEFIVAGRRAAWASAGLMLLAAAVHVVARPVAAGAVLAALALPWGVALAWAGRRRPAESACALWADRHLGGASAFGTLIEAGRPGTAGRDAAAVRWLVQWAQARVPDAHQRLAQHHEPLRLARPLLSMLVCTALAALVQVLPDPAPAAAPAAAVTASAPAGLGDRPLAAAEAPTALATEITRALRPAASRETPEPPGSGGGAPTAGGGTPDDRPPAATAPPGATPRGDAAAARDMAAAGAPVDAAPPTGATQVAGAGSGREAGDSRDERADVGVSRALRGAIPVQRSEAGARRSSADRQADMARGAAMDDGPSTPGGAAAPAGVAAAASPPPTATEAAWLTATETSYVQAWMKSSARTR